MDAYFYLTSMKSQQALKVIVYNCICIKVLHFMSTLNKTAALMIKIKLWSYNVFFISLYHHYIILNQKVIVECSGKKQFA